MNKAGGLTSVASPSLLFAYTLSKLSASSCSLRNPTNISVTLCSLNAVMVVKVFGKIKNPRADVSSRIDSI